ncbi:MBL fold metallo-hydrolase [Thiorhodovibrio frisius]|uniref:Putative hydrolase of the metallo-beta-lactamase superfamily n=1 Tax=Thiorhodovibrio frisius TaxID=631362 RepID=H8YVH9_9GAMM|nr:MBL fold metallo-hydrolase [Thiorhodovibrio frisius]EIC23919.1 putative hydrolase of the metallo-beta-lactamase superfamily [Thiorhodovibrio frisius]WPL23171.1 Putative ribonuclease Jc [Thiorhodovibrio frisius]
MNFKIHRGTKEIGGSCVEVWTESTRIIIDFGMPLVNPDRTQFDSRAIKDSSVDELIVKRILPDVDGLYDESGTTALILSHAHQDHFGLINYVNANCQTYLGRATQKLIEITNIFTNQDWTIPNPQHFESGKSFFIGDIEITPYLMDHSAFDAYAFLIKAGGKSLFYSGDFRIHGRKTKAFDWFSYNAEKNIDYLLLEGTTIGRANKNFPTESEIEEEFVDTFKTSKGINLIYTSGQNIDRIVSIYRACKRAGKTFAVDFYIANILKELSEFATIPYPSYSFPEIKVFFPYRLSRMISKKGNEKLLYRFKDYKITKEQIGEEFDKTVMIVRPSMLKDLEFIKGLENGIFIYSMWEGYKKEKPTKEFIGFLIKRGMTEKSIHTSGHADREALKRMVEVLSPKNLVPIHTFEGDEYKKIFTGTKVVRISDNETVTIT